MTYNVDFRRHVLAVHEREGLTFQQTSERFSVGVAGLVRWVKSPEPKATRNGRPRKIDLEKLRQDVRDHPDAYHHERATRFGVTPKAIWQALKKLGVTYKKAFHHPKADDDKRRYFLEKIEGYEKESRPIVYIDESGFATDMPRTHGYSTRGKRCFGTQNWNAKGRLNAIGALLVGVLLRLA